MKQNIVLAISAIVVLSVAFIVSNPVCIDSDTAVADKVYNSCIAGTWMSQQCKQTAQTVACKRWAFWLLP